MTGVPAKRIFTHERDVATYSVWSDLPRWSGGMLVGYEHNHSSNPVIYTIDRDGKREDTLFTLEDGAQINIYNIDASLDGELAIVASALAVDKRGATFLARIAPDRQHQIITRTWPYCPGVVTFAPDGTIWTVGNMKDFENTRDLDRNVLRRFDSTGKMLSSVALQARGWEIPVASFLRASRDRVGWFTRGGEYIEFSLDGSEIGRYDGPEGATPGDITGVALSEDNDVVVGRFGNAKAEFLLLDREKRTWIPVTVPKEQSPKWAWVFGFDGTKLVTYSKNGTLRRYHTK